MKMRRAYFFAVAQLFIVSVMIAHAQTSGDAASEVQASKVPQLVPFNGSLADVRGNAVVTFSLYEDSSSGTPLWQEVQLIKVDDSGRFSVFLGSTSPEGLPLDVFANGTARWLGVQPQGYLEAPRVLLVSVPYALKAADADTVGGKPLSAFVLAGDKTGTGPDGLTYLAKDALSQESSVVEAATLGSAGYIGVFTGETDLGNSVMFQSANKIGVGTTFPAATFHVASPAAPAAFFEVYSNFLGALPTVFRAARGTPFAPLPVQTHDILGGLAVQGYTPGGFSFGKGQVMFKAAENWTNTANGTYLQFTTTPVGSTVFAERMRIDPFGNVGIGTTAPAFPLDVAGTVRVSTGTGGLLLGGSPNTIFIGSGDSTGLGVSNIATEGAGIFSSAEGTDSYAVFGSADNATGVAIAGLQPSIQGWAGFFGGDVGVTGILVKGGGAFKIDHPLDPANKYLSHSFVESPDMKNIYDGVALLDESGEAMVTLPDWFEALNEDFRYQLTPIGAAFVPYVAEEIAGNRFKIAGGAPGNKVSWQVTGIRHDAFANSNRIQVEELKPEAAVGTYLHPEAFGQSIETELAAGQTKDVKGTDQKAREQKTKEQRARLRAISQKPAKR